MLADVVRERRLEPEAQLRVARMVYGWGDGSLHDELIRSIVAFDKAGKPMSDLLYSELLQAEMHYSLAGKHDDLESLYLGLSDDHAKTLFILNSWDPPRANAVFARFVADLQSRDSDLVFCILNELCYWSNRPDLKPQHRPNSLDAPRPAQWAGLIDHWRKPGALAEVQKG